MNFYRCALKLKWLVGWAYFKLSILQGLLPWWLDHRHHIPSQTGTLTTTYPTSLSPLTWRCRMPVTRKLTTVTNPFRTSARIIHPQDRMDRYSSKEYLLLQENGTLMDDSLSFSGTSGRATFSCKRSPAVIQSTMWFLLTGHTARFVICLCCFIYILQGVFLTGKS